MNNIDNIIDSFINDIYKVRVKKIYICPVCGSKKFDGCDCPDCGFDAYCF